jgi:transposase InsO family protein
MGARRLTETLCDGRRSGLLTVIDEGNRERLDIAMACVAASHRVARVLNELIAVNVWPTAVGVDNGADFTAQPFVEW